MRKINWPFLAALVLNVAVWAAVYQWAGWSA